MHAKASVVGGCLCFRTPVGWRESFCTCLICAGNQNTSFVSRRRSRPCSSGGTQQFERISSETCKAVAIIGGQGALARPPCAKPRNRKKSSEFPVFPFCAKTRVLAHRDRQRQNGSERLLFPCLSYLSPNLSQNRI